MLSSQATLPAVDAAGQAAQQHRRQQQHRETLHYRLRPEWSAEVRVSTLDALEESGARLSPGATQFSLARFVAWDFWPFWQGLVFTGMAASGSRVVAHECGHQALSPSKTINNAVDWVLHSALMVPHHSWRIFDARHHAGTGHLSRDEVFVPRTRAQRSLKNLRPLPTDEDEADTVRCQAA
ncbi:unnamed protein product [Tilletia controversa]|nr:unnamed protein product [Tilletia controversa]